MRLAQLALVFAIPVALSGAALAFGQTQPGHQPTSVETSRGSTVLVDDSAQAAGGGGQAAADLVGDHALGADEPRIEKRWHTPVEIGLSIGVLTFGLLVLVMLGSLLRSGHIAGGSFVKLFVLGVVVTSGLFVVVAGYTQDQIAPMMGLLGTLVGYLLGREGNAAPKDKPVV